MSSPWTGAALEEGENYWVSKFFSHTLMFRNNLVIVDKNPVSVDSSDSKNFGNDNNPDREMMNGNALKNNDF